MNFQFGRDLQRNVKMNMLSTFGRSPYFLLTSLLIFNSAGPVVIAHAGDDSIYGMKIVVNELDPRRNIFDLRIQETYTGPGEVERFTEPKIHFRITDQIPKTHASEQPRPVEPIPDTGLVSKISDKTEMLGASRTKKYLGIYYFIYRPGRYDLFATDQIIIPHDLVKGMPDSAKRTRLLQRTDESGKYCTDDMATSPTVTFTVAPWTEEWFNPGSEPDDLLQLKLTADVKDPHKLVIDEVIKPRPAFRTAVDMDPKEAEQWESGVFAGQGGRLVELKGKANTDKLLRLEGTDDYSRLLTDSWTVCLIYHNGKLLEQPKRLPMPDAQAVETDEANQQRSDSRQEWITINHHYRIKESLGMVPLDS